jgi:hypothetical protein
LGRQWFGFTSGDVFVSDSGHLRITVADVGTTARVTVDLAPSRPTVALSQAEWLPAGEGTVDVLVDAGGMPWSATSSAGWLSATPAAGSGRMMTLTGSAYTAGPPRSGTVTVTAGGTAATVEVTQTAADDDCGDTAGPASCVWSVASSTAVSGMLENNSDVDYWRLSVPTTGEWTITLWGRSSAITGAVRDATDGVMGYFRLGVVGLGSSATLMLTAGATYFVSATPYEFQASAGPYALEARPVSATVTPAPWAASATGGAQSVTVVTPGTSWTVTSAPEWMSITPSAGSAGGAATLTAQYNAGAARSGSVVFAAGGQSATVNVRQNANPSAVLTAVAGAPIAGAGGYQPVTVVSGSPWTVTGLPSWAMASRMSGSASDSNTIVTAAINPGPRRQATMTFTNTAGTMASVPIAQEAVESIAWNVGAAPEVSGTLAATSAETIYSVTVPTSGPWVFRVISANGGVSVQLRDANGGTPGYQRGWQDSPDCFIDGTLVAGQTYFLLIGSSGTTPAGAYTASATPAAVTLTPSTLAVPDGTSTRTITVTSPSGVYTASSDSPWLDATPRAGTGIAVADGTEVTVSVSANTGQTRTGHITFSTSDGGESARGIHVVDPGWCCVWSGQGVCRLVGS